MRILTTKDPNVITFGAGFYQNKSVKEMFGVQFALLGFFGPYVFGIGM